jgi:hypothetical protein
MIAADAQKYFTLRVKRGQGGKPVALPRVGSFVARLPVVVLACIIVRLSVARCSPEVMTTRRRRRVGGLRGRAQPGGRHRRHVLLLEAGGPGEGVASLWNPPQWVENIGAAYNWAYRYEPSPHVADRSIPFSLGRCLADREASMVWSWSAETEPTTTVGRRPATPDGTSTPCCPCSRSPKTGRAAMFIGPLHGVGTAVALTEVSGWMWPIRDWGSLLIMASEGKGCMNASVRVGRVKPNTL